MTNREKVNELKRIIYETLTPYITKNYWLLDVPHHDNVGDILIWQGEIDFLASRKYRCLGMSASDSAVIPNISDGDLILFHGGGNFGDLWPIQHQYKKLIMAKFPRCKYLFFPQTVWWENEQSLSEDANFFANYDCTICARDKVSYAKLKDRFKNEILLVPDMAFCMNISKYLLSPKQFKRPFLLRRNDIEFMPHEKIAELTGSHIEAFDWTPIMKKTKYHRLREILQQTLPRSGWLYELFMYHIYRPFLIRSGVRQLLSYTDIYTTRLHGLILSILLNKDSVFLFDNSYSKNFSFYTTWLTDLEAVGIIK